MSEIDQEFEDLISSYDDLIDGNGQNFEKKIMFTFANLQQTNWM